jgi:hypothetical protein
MQNGLIFGAVLLLALLASSLPALVHREHRNLIRESWRHPLRLVLGVLSEELGAVTVTYYVRGGPVTINGSTTPATAQQASQVQKQSAIVVFGVTADVACTFTHNWGLDASAPTYIEPEILYEFLSTALTTFSPLITFDRSNTNAVFINKPATGDACTLRVTLRRPQSIGQ